MVHRIEIDKSLDFGARCYKVGWQVSEVSDPTHNPHVVTGFLHAMMADMALIILKQTKVITAQAEEFKAMSEELRNLKNKIGSLECRVSDLAEAS